MTNDIKLTELEKQVLEGINNSDYGEVLGDPIWRGAVKCAIQNTRKIRGVFSSLAKKGLIETYEEGKESTVWLTGNGIRICKQYDLLGKFK